MSVPHIKLKVNNIWVRNYKMLITQNWSTVIVFTIHWDKYVLQETHIKKI